MDVSEENLKLIEKIRKFRNCKELEETLKLENELLKQEKEDYEEALVELSSELLDRADLLGKIKDLEAENQRLLLNSKRLEKEYDFIVTTPHDISSVYGEIREQLSNAK
jgi:predicted nuclease with TOPRIM domain